MQNKKICRIFFIFLLSPYNCFANYAFQCPEKGANDILEKYDFEIDCTQLTIDCALMHKGNEAILTAIRSVKCIKETISSQLLDDENAILSVLPEPVAIQLLEDTLCKAEPLVKYKMIAKIGMFFRNVSCSRSIVQGLLGMPLIYYKKNSAALKETLALQMYSWYFDQANAIFHKNLFDGILSSKDPFLSAAQVVKLHHAILFVSEYDEEKYLNYMRALFKGPFDKPIRKSLSKHGLYLDYDKNDDKSFVHICQAFRQHVIPRLNFEQADPESNVHKGDGEKELIRISSARKVVEICDNIVDPSFFNNSIGIFSLCFFIVLVLSLILIIVLFIKKQLKSQGLVLENTPVKKIDMQQQ